MKNLPLGIQTFRDFIQQEYVYVDKTQHIYDLLAGGGKYYFLSRPRRFGKSVLLSTLAEIFSGNRELFHGLWIYDKIEWIKHPVIHLDLSKITFKSQAALEKSLAGLIEKNAGEYNIQLDHNLFLKEKFGQLIERLYQTQQQKVVILIDEYDKPIIEYMEAAEITLAKQMRRILKNFYSIIKGSDEYLRFVFITGVSKFSKVSIFSDLNNLRDITLSREFAVLLGYTETELQKYFEPHINELADEMEISQKELLADIKQWYNGYSWDGENFVYNPFSIINFFKEKSFDNFWFSSGTPSFLLKIMKKNLDDVTAFENLPVKTYTFESFDIENIEIAALLFQTGYLTIKRTAIQGRQKSKTFYLSYPNKEVQDSFLTHILDAFTRKKMTLSTRHIDTLNAAIEQDNIENFIQELKILFAAIPYRLFIREREAYYHSIIYLTLKLSGAAVHAEDPTNRGRIDAVLESGKKIYIIEFKMGTAQEALNQIKEKKYYEKYLAKGKEIVLVGVGFDAKQRNISNYLLDTTIVL